MRALVLLVLIPLASSLVQATPAPVGAAVFQNGHGFFVTIPDESKFVLFSVAWTPRIVSTFPDMYASVYDMRPLGSDGKVTLTGFEGSTQMCANPSTGRSYLHNGSYYAIVWSYLATPGAADYAFTVSNATVTPDLVTPVWNQNAVSQQFVGLPCPLGAL